MRVEVVKTGNFGHNVYAACLAHELTPKEFEQIAALEQWPEPFRQMCRSNLKF
jgi:hypothetical protein